MPEDPDREERIEEIVVDAYDEYERSMGWYYYLGDNLQVPFPAYWRNKKVEVIGMASEGECEADMRVEIQALVGGEAETISIRLEDIEPLDEVDEQTKQAVADWHYWVEQGYEF
ncbi:MAG: calcium-binding protein [Cyanobacteria bacterium P01_E01_bin.42]